MKVLLNRHEANLGQPFARLHSRRSARRSVLGEFDARTAPFPGPEVCKRDQGEQDDHLDRREVMFARNVRERISVELHPVA
jgi:hypothetical protein